MGGEREVEKRFLGEEIGKQKSVGCLTAIRSSFLLSDNTLRLTEYAQRW